AAGNLTGFLYSSDGTTIPINVNAVETSNPSGIIIFPTSKVINIQQGAEKTQNIQIIVPSNYPSSITIQSVSFSPDVEVIHFGDLNLGVLAPSQTLNIPIVIDAKNVQVGTYNTQISILATDSNGQISLPSVNVQIVVSVGISPVDNSTFSTKPDCALSSLEFNLNSTYEMTCTNVISNIQINVPYNEFFQGTKAEYSGGTYKYYFKALKLGSTKFVATFEYLGSTIFTPFEKEVRISTSGSSPVGDVNLKLQFFQDGQEQTNTNLKAGKVILMALDNKTSNIVKPFEIYLNGDFINSSEITLDSEKVYTLRVTADGYNDFNLNNLSVAKKTIVITLIPNQETYQAGDIIEITTDANASIMIDNVIILSKNYTLNKVGNVTIKAVKEGYLDSEKIILVDSDIYLDSTSCSLEPGKWKVGKKDIMCRLNQAVNWNVYLNGTLISNGTTEAVKFSLENEGLLELKMGDTILWNQIIEKKGIFRWMLEHWIWTLIGLAVLVGVFFVIRGGSEEDLLGSIDD
ncbi:MAG: hypothetical protein KKB31_03920, partial [Nanoarchaeota archaeon]|nr:hypothetical protein [Nanoarchaeota archaeon]